MPQKYDFDFFCRVGRYVTGGCVRWYQMNTGHPSSSEPQSHPTPAIIYLLLTLDVVLIRQGTKE